MRPTSHFGSPSFSGPCILIFSEGYHGASAHAVIRTDLCRESIRLAQLLAKHPLGAVPSTLALCALMYLDAARLPARLDALGRLELVVRSGSLALGS